jgi:hypothetical protein
MRNNTTWEMQMEAIKTANRIHPLMAAAAVSVVIVSLAGTAAITGMLPSSHANVQTPAPVAAPVLAQEAPLPAEMQAPAPAAKTSHVHHAHQATTQHLAQSSSKAAGDGEYQAPHAAPAQPNYLGIGAGAVIGGLLGNQVGGGRGRALATVAGAVGGGMIGNEVQNRTR